MRAAEPTPRKDRQDPASRAVLDAWPLPAQSAVPEADEPLPRATEGEDEPITEKVPTETPGGPRGGSAG